MQSKPSSPGTLTSSLRIRGLDTARALAIFGMFWAHVGPMDLQGLAGRAFALPHGRASLLFAILAGISLEIIYRRTGCDFPSFRRKILWRAGWLLAAGLLLQIPDHGIAVILQYYGVVFLVCAFFVPLSSSRILGLAVTFTLLGGTVYFLGNRFAPGIFDRASATLLAPPWETAVNLLATGAYPAMVWISPVLFGIWLGRQDLRSRNVSNNLMKWGLSAFAATALLTAVLEIKLGYPPNTGYYRLIFIEAHSQLPLWLLNGAGLACFFLGFSLSVTDRFPRLTNPFQSAGRTALTLYVAQLLAFAAWGGSIRAQSMAEGAFHSLLLLGAATLLAVAMLRMLPRGPLEWLISPSAPPERRS